MPGDPNRVFAEYTHLFDVANQINDQIGRLRTIATSDSSLKGHAADQIRSSAHDIAGKLGTVRDRYQNVGSALQDWLPELETAQQQSLTVLRQAQDAGHRQGLFTNPPAGQPETQAEKQSRQNNLSAANSDLAAAKNRLNGIVAERDHDAAVIAGRIRKAIDDNLKDSWWDQFKDWVSENAGWISAVCTILEIVATVLAVVALLLLPGVGWVILAGAIVTGIAAAGRLILAATGNGSWLDFALDFVSLLTFGIGGRLLVAMKGVVGSTSRIADGLIQAMRDASWLGKAGNFVEDAGGILGRIGNAMRTGGAAQLADSFISKLPILDKLPELFGQADEGAMNFGEKVTGWGTNLLEKAVPSLQKIAEDADTSALERLLHGGDQGAVNLTKQMQIFADAFPKNPEIMQNLATYGQYLKAFQTNFMVTTGVTVAGDVSDALSGFHLGPINIPAWGPWDNIEKNIFTTQGGLF